LFAVVRQYFQDEVFAPVQRKPEHQRHLGLDMSKSIVDLYVHNSLMYISQYSNELLQNFDEFLRILTNSYKFLQILTNSSHSILILFNSQVSSEHEDYLSTRMQARQANKRL